MIVAVVVIGAPLLLYGLLRWVGFLLTHGALPGFLEGVPLPPKQYW
jgi:hypothetical protein